MCDIFKESKRQFSYHILFIFICSAIILTTIFSVY